MRRRLHGGQRLKGRKIANGAWTQSMFFMATGIAGAGGADEAVSVGKMKRMDSARQSRILWRIGRGAGQGRGRRSILKGPRGCEPRHALKGPSAARWSCCRISGHPPCGASNASEQRLTNFPPVPLNPEGFSQKSSAPTPSWGAGHAYA